MRFCKAAFVALVLLLTARTSSSQTNLEKGLQLSEEGRIEEAKAVFELLLKEDPEYAEAHFQLGKLYLSLEDHDRSIDSFKRAVELNESSSIYHQWLGRAIGLKAQKGSKLKALFRAKKAKGEFEKAVELDPQNIGARFDLLQYYLQAPGIAGGSKEKAVEQAKEILEYDTLQGRRAFALIYENSKNYGEAEQRYVEATQLDSLNTEPYYWLGFFYQRQERYDEAMQVFEQILEIDPEEMAALYQVGRTCIFAKKNLGKAEECFQKYLQVKPKPSDPDWASAHWRLGMVYDLKGERGLAISEWEKALELNPDHKQAKEALEKVGR
ncbi:MAG: tetratricopeptide repeat protein [bacterium]